MADDGLITVTPSETDGRVRLAELTSAGQAERAELDRLSDDAAGAILGPLTGRQRDRLITAMAEVERLLTASAIELAGTDPRAPGALACQRAYASELAIRFEAGYDPAQTMTVDDAELTPAGLLLVASLDGEPVGCGAVILAGPGPAKIRRMWVSAAVRGLGLGRRILAGLEAHAAAAGASVVRLEINRALTEAISLYRSAGYREVPAFSDEHYATTGSRRRCRSAEIRSRVDEPMVGPERAASEQRLHLPGQPEADRLAERVGRRVRYRRERVHHSPAVLVPGQFEHGPDGALADPPALELGQHHPADLGQLRPGVLMRPQRDRARHHGGSAGRG